MRLPRIFVTTVCLAIAAPASADSLTADCDVPTMLVAVECLQPKLDARIEQADKLFEENLSYVTASAHEAPEAGIDSAAVVRELRVAKEQWTEFAEHECAAVREFVGTGTDKDSVEMVCLIRLYDRRIQELASWREL